MTGLIDKKAGVNDLFSFQELESVVLKTIAPTTLNGKKYPTGTVMAIFDRISIAALQAENKATKAKSTKTEIIWESLEDIQLTFAQGVFSLLHFNFMTNSKLFKKGTDSETIITQVEKLTTDENGKLSLIYPSNGKHTFYSDDSVVEPIASEEGKHFTFEYPYLPLTVVYEFLYYKETAMVEIGNPLTSVLMSLEGRVPILTEKGERLTGILRIPKLKIISNLRIEVGKQANPNVAVFQGVAIPDGPRNNTRVAEFEMLYEELSAEQARLNEENLTNAKTRAIEEFKDPGLYPITLRGEIQTFINEKTILIEEATRASRVEEIVGVIREYFASLDSRVEEINEDLDVIKNLAISEMEDAARTKGLLEDEVLLNATIAVSACNSEIEVEREKNDFLTIISQM